jgi:Mrp family chromosome partitioning ATPase
MTDDQTFEQQPSMAEQSNEITYVVGVMSGKGGVGKSIVTGLFASALRNAGYEVGILDADVTGPSIPKMFGIDSRPDVCDFGIFPVETATGIKLISINLLLSSPDDAVIWRGPLISNAVTQFWHDVFWGKLDYLLVDLPPGTADVPLTVMQSLPLDSVIIVTSPQDLAAMIVRKAVNMCRQMNVPILGLVQNMAWFKCPKCGEITYPFGHTNGELLAQEMKVPHLLDLPIDPEISSRCDSGAIEGYAANQFTEKLEIIANGLMALKHARNSEVCDAGDTADRQ